MQAQGENQDCLAGGGEMGALMRSFDWSKTPIGDVESWSPALRMMVRLLLANRFPLLLWWGPRYCQLYNDPYRPVLGNKHPASLGQPASECFPEIWDVIGPLIDTPFSGGPATWMDDLQLEYIRYNRLEEAHFTVAYSPVPDETVPSGIGGVLATVHEITGKVVGERRVVVLRDLGAHAAEAKTAEKACATAAKTLAGHDKDVPFALIYLLDAAGKHATLAAASGVAEGGTISPKVVGLDGTGWSLAEVLEFEALRVFPDLTDRFGIVPPGPWSDRPTSAVVLPVPSAKAHHPAGLLVAGVSARLEFDEKYRGFLELVAGQIGTAIANAHAYEEEKKRGEALAELDRAKTAFFLNISHEFRTPLTLILGPVEDALADPANPLSPGQRERLETAHRSSLRLLKLVNTLLDFSRIEAGRVQASYAPTDVAALTAELASTFQSACEKAGLRLVVDCPPLPEPVFVDRDMWEKVVLNLLSNAFKFTFEGEIAVRLRPAGNAAELAVLDTGTGIPAAELPRVFERFHRVEGSRGRTHEGTGIGLALVQELVKLHGGSMRAESTVGGGSTFTVAVPLGTAHLPADRIGAPRTFSSTTVGAGAFVEEALRWLPDEETSRSFPDTVGNAREAFPPEVVAPRPPHAREPDDVVVKRPRVLWADDNADMRHYVRRLLGERYDLEAVPDGEAALAAVRARPPDLVLSDVMMPRLDGFGLLNALRSDPTTRTIPVILLSARAGEESRVEGLEAGADDYLVKPFSARELLARVGAHLEMARVQREAAERVAHTFENITDGLMILDPEWRYTYVNAQAERLVGRTRAELLGKCVWDVFPVAVGTEVERQLRQAAAEQVTCEFEGYNADWDRWYENRACPTPDGGVAVYFRDITDRRKAEQTVRESEARFRNMADHAPVMIWVTDAAGACTYLNERWCRFTGTTPERGFGFGWLESVHPDDRDQALAAFRAANGPRTSFRFEYRLLRHDGQYRWAIDSAAPRLGLSGEFLGYIGSVLDVTEEKRQEEVLRRSEMLLAEAQQIAHIGSWSWDLESNEIVWSDEHYRSVGLQPQEVPMTAERARSYIHPDDRTAAWEAVQRSIRDRQPYEWCLRMARADGTPLIALSRGQAVYDETGKPVRMSGTIQDVTERKRLEADLRQAKEAAEAASRAKDEFLANVSHEIRTPFGAILGMTEQVLDTPLTDDQRQCLETVRSAADSLLGLVDALLDFEKIEAGKLALGQADFSLRETLSDTVRTLVVRARTKGLKLTCDVHQDAPDALVGDADRLRQVLLNLIGNAIKFTNEGQVAVRVEVADGTAPEGEAVLRFAVTDTGIGIPPEGRERIFRAFEQVDSSTTRRYGGTGLGLTIAARLVGLMGGTIDVESEPGRSSTFAFTARFGRQPHPRERVVAQPSDALHEAATPTPVAAPLRTLVAEDSEFNSRHLERLLTRRGHAVRVATDGREALNLAVEGAFDLLLLDLQMPELDGFQVAQAVRQREQSTGGHLPIIALTARTRKEDRERCLAAGMDDYLPKPVRAAELLAAIDRVVAVQGASRAAQPDVEDGGSLIDPVTLLAGCGDDAEGLRALCQDFEAYAPSRLAEVGAALRDRDVPRLRMAAHTLCGLLSVFSTVAGTVASDLEDLAAHGRLDEARPLVERLAMMVQELVRQVGGLSYERLRHQAATADRLDRSAGA